MSTRAISRAAFFLYLAAVAYMCFGRPEQLPEMDRFILGIPTDKLAHFSMFFPFPILAWLAFSRGRRRLIPSLISFYTFGILVAAATEFGQSLTDYRSGDLLDLAADALGLLTGTIITTIISKLPHDNA